MPEHETSGGGGPADQGAHPPIERLRAFLDDDLPAADAREVEEHLEVCERCVAALDQLEPAPVLPRAAGAPAWDERRMRRAVRRTVLRTAVNTVLLLVLAALLLQVVGWFVVHPLLVDRGGRLQSHVTATIDLPVLLIPGAEGDELVSNPGWLGRTTEVEFRRSVGSRPTSIGSFGTRTGPFGMSTTSGWDLSPGAYSLETGPGERNHPTPFEPKRLGEGTAVTVELQWLRPVDLEAADAVAASSAEVALLWVGFRVPGAPHPQDPGWTLGYSAYAEPWPDLSEMRSGGFGTSDATQWRFHGDDLGARHALGEVRRATANLAAIGWPAVDDPDGYGALADLDATADALAGTEPGVASVVITGPTQAVAEAIEEARPDQAQLLEIDFDL